MDAPVRERNSEDRIYNGLTFSVLEIEDALRIVTASVKTLRENFDSRHMVGVKSASEQVEKVAGQIGTLAGSLKNTATLHLNRRPRS